MPQIHANVRCLRVNFVKKQYQVMEKANEEIGNVGWTERFNDIAARVILYKRLLIIIVSSKLYVFQNTSFC